MDSEVGFSIIPKRSTFHQHTEGRRNLDWLNRLVVTALPLVPKPLVRRVSSRYIAGDKIEDAVRTVRELNQRGMMATLDILGEFITLREEATSTASEYIQALETIDRERLDSNISIKLTAFGLKLDFDFCLDNVRRVVARAKELGNFVRIDMEDSSCTSDTLRLYDLLRRDYHNLGTVIQAYMRRAILDIRQLMNNGTPPTNLRLCKGIYVEPRSIAYKNRELINNLLNAGITLSNPLIEETETPLDGLTFVFTGSLDRWTRSEAQRLVEDRGGRSTSSVSGNTDYVVAGPGAGSKLDDAEELGVPVLDEEEFVEFLKDRVDELELEEN